MLSFEYAKGDKSIGLIVGNKYYAWTDFIGKNFGIPLKKYDTDIARRMLGISTMELADGKKLPKKQLVNHCEEILEACDTMGIDKLLVVSADYFKYLSGTKGFEDEIGNVLSCNIGGYEHIKICPCINPAVISAQPNKKGLLTKSLDTFGHLIAGTYSAKKEFEFESYELVTSTDRLKLILAKLLEHPIITCDIETTGLRLGEAEILTIAFAWDEYNAVTIPCHDHWCLTMDTEETISILKEFFRNYKGKLLFHNALFDVKHIVFNWFMSGFNDTQGIYDGLEALNIDNIHDTMLLAYCELNSTERPSIGLKTLSKDHLGNYAEDVKDCKVVPLDNLAIYNAKDCCGTFYVYNLYKHQETSRGYTEIMRPSLKPLLHMMINGLPIDMDRVAEASETITGELEKAKAILKDSTYVRDSEENLRYLAMVKYNATHVGNKEAWEFDVEFNANSAVQLRVLLFDVMEFEPVEFTETGAAKTDRASIAEFISSCPEDDPRLDTLKALKAISETAIIQNTFISSFQELSLTDADGNYTLHGNLRLGGTQSARLSSSEPNLQNLPSGSSYGKTIKNCFVAPDGWLFAYADFSSLEDKIGAILSGDKNKTMEFTDGVDGHSMRGAAFFPEELEERGIFIDMTNPESINRIKDEAPDIRGMSKGPSFAMQYGCAAPKLQKMLKCTMDKAQNIFNAYHKLYSGLGDFAKRNEQFAKANGYIELAFGLTLKTPRINSRDGGIQSGESRSASNAATQSYGTLMNRAFIEFQERIESHGMTGKVKLINTIHDAVYMLIKDDVDTVAWVNKHLIECMEWQEDEKLKSNVKIGAELDIGKDWAHCVTLPNWCSDDYIKEVLSELSV